MVKKAPKAKVTTSEPTAPEPKPTVPSHPAPPPSLAEATARALQEENVALQTRVAELTAWIEKTVKTATIDYGTAHTVLRR